MPRPKSWGAGFNGAGGRAPRLPAELTAPIATTGDGRDITRAYIGELEQPRDPRLSQSVDWGVYERILMDDQVKSCMEQRIRAVVSRDWSVTPGNEDDARSVHASERMEAQLRRIGWDQRTERMLWAVFYGYSVAEALWSPRRDEGRIEQQWDQLRVRHARRFRWDRDGRLRLLTRSNLLGEVLPDRKFWVVTSGGTNDDEPYGRGLAEWLYFPTWFKRNGVRFWNIFLDKFSVPTAKGTYPRGSTRGEIDKLLEAMMAIANDSGFAIPEGMNVELLHLAQSGADFGAVCRYMDGCIAKIILSQTMTTDNGSSRSQGEVHADVKLEIIKADTDLLTDSFTTGPARWWTDLNYGADVAAPTVTRMVEEEDDLKEAADTDAVLHGLGWRRSEESMQDRYGDGYERIPEPKTAPVVEPRAAPDADAEDDDAEQPGNVVPLRAPAFAEPAHGDRVDEAVAAIMEDEGFALDTAAMIDPLLADLRAADGPDAVTAILARQAGFDTTAFAERLARAGFALRLDALTGEDDA